MKSRFFFLLVTYLALGILDPCVSQEHSHGVGPNGGVVFDLGSYHAEFTVDHDKHQVAVQFLGADEQSLTLVVAKDLVLSTNETTTEDGTAVSAMTIYLQPLNPKNGKASTYVGEDLGIAQVVDFSGVLTGEIDGKPAFGEFDEATVDRSHEHGTPHDGVVAVLNDASGSPVGFVELKLHDDKGDLELWIAKDREMKQPIDISAKSQVKVSFQEPHGKVAILHVRDQDQNADEQGKANLRNGKTNYFIFPGSTGSPSEWLQGKDFSSEVSVSFEVGGKVYQSETFHLAPHTHGNGKGHTHPHEEEHDHPHKKS
jgi:hypothetical protein